MISPIPPLIGRYRPALYRRWRKRTPERRRAGPKARPVAPIRLACAYHLPPDGQPPLPSVVQVRAVLVAVFVIVKTFPDFEVAVTV